MATPRMSGGRASNSPSRMGGEKAAVGMEPAFFEDLSQLCLKSVAAGKLPTYRVVSERLKDKYGDTKVDGLKNEISVWMRNFCSVQGNTPTDEITDSVDGKSNRRMAYVTVMSKPVFHRAHAHKVCIRTDLTTDEWVCDVCFTPQAPDVMRWRCSKQCDWDCCRLCMAAYRGRKKQLKLRHRKADPLGIIFSQLEVVGCYAGSVAEACGEVLPGDLLLSFDGHEVTSFARMAELVRRKSSRAMGGHDPNALVTTVLTFAEPYPHRDRVREIIAQREDDPVRKQPMEALQTEIRILYQSMAAFRESPSLEEQGVIAMMERKAAALEAEVRRRHEEQDAQSEPRSSPAPGDPGVAGDSKGHADNGNNAEVEVQVDTNAAVPVGETAAAAPLVRPPTVDRVRNARRDRYSSYGALADKLNLAMVDERSEDGGGSTISMSSPVHSLKANSPFSQLSATTAPSQSPDAATRQRRVSSTDVPPSCRSSMVMDDPLVSTSLRSSPSYVRSSASSIEPPSTNGGGGANATVVVDGHGDVSLDRRHSDSVSVAMLAPTPDSTSQATVPASELDRVMDELERMRKSEAGAYRMLTKTNAKLAMTERSLERAMGAEAGYKARIVELERQVKTAEDTSASLQRRVDELTALNAQLVAERDAGQPHPTEGKN
eukprot:m.191874 g.191874  ORF g.191874 m.191874 type:complete len:659 (-) comp18484_c0_seq1:144-2120(-)